MKNRFVSIEGGEGCGKSTLIENLKKAMQFRDDVVFVNDPSKDLDIAVEFRRLLLSEKFDLEPCTELMLYMSARAELTHKVIIPALKEGKLVISDRFDLSTWAYQGIGRGIDNFYITALTDLIDHVPPSLFFVLDIDPEIGLSRSKARLSEGNIDEGKFENLDLSFHTGVRNYMRAAAKKDSRGRLVDVQALNPDQVRTKVLGYLDEEGFI